MAEHFVHAPDWGWYIIGYFFVAGLAGGSYALATMLRVWGTAHDGSTARSGYLLAFPLTLVCALFLTLDLGRPLRFWHMMIDTTPGAMRLNFYPWSPISLGTWALLAFTVFAFVSFVDALARRGGRSGLLHGSGGLAFAVAGSILGLFLASYTGVVLSVSNQPVWSDSYAIGGLFVASALSSSSALLALVANGRDGNGIGSPTERRLVEADGYFGILELLMLAAFFVTLANAGTLWREGEPPALVLWALVLLSIVPTLRGLAPRRATLATSAGTVATARTASRLNTAAAIVVLVGVLLLRVVVILGAQS